MERMRILIVEPSPMVVEGLRAILSASKQCYCLPPMYSVEHLADYLRREMVDVLVINPTLLNSPLVCSLRDLRRDVPHLCCVALVYQYVERRQLQAYQAVLDVREQREAIVPLLSQARQQSVEQTSEVLENYELSDREIDVLKLVAQGLMNKEIADQLNISIHTVISHRKNITRKTGIKSVAGLTMYVLMNNL